MTQHFTIIGPHNQHDLDALQHQLAECQRQLEEGPERNMASIRAAIRDLEEAIADGRIKR